MEGLRFYLEAVDKDKQWVKKYKPTRNQDQGVGVIAVNVDNKGRPLDKWLSSYPSEDWWTVSTISSIYYKENSPVCCSGAPLEYIGSYCTRTSEAHARKVHPKLFEYLEE